MNENTKHDDIDILKKISLQNVSSFSLDGQTYYCGVYLGDPTDINEKRVKSDVYDGDTLHVVIIYLGIPHKFTIRMLGIDTPEMRPKWKQPVKDELGEIKMVRVSDETHELEKRRAIESRNALKEYIWHKNLLVKFGKNDKFGSRVLANLFIIDDTGNLHSVNDWMIENKYAMKYDGSKKKAFDPSS